MKLTQKDIEKMMDDDEDTFLDNQDVINSRVAKLKEQSVKNKREENSIYHNQDPKRNQKRKF